MGDKMMSRGWRVLGLYAVALFAASWVAIASMFIPMAGTRFEFDWPYWIGIMGPMALLYVGASAYVPGGSEPRRVGAFALLSAAAFASLVPLVDPSVTGFERASFALVIAFASGAVMGVSFSIFRSLAAGHLTRTTITVVLIWTSAVASYTLYQLLRYLEGFGGAYFGLSLALLTLNGLAIQRWMGWREMTKHDNALLGRAGLVATVWIGGVLLYMAVL